ncbi:MAG TPA: segregation/condensation protein A, partial [Methyloceanibacter sp.]|nr:segregation/condensation protein A [Methyloceanibacter sp.]
MDETENTMAEEPEEPGLSDWDATEERQDVAPDETLVVDVEGFEGPLDLLLALARTQKVDLA